MLSVADVGGKRRKKGWRTSLAGWAILGLVGVQVAANPKTALHERTVDLTIQGLAAAGLIKAADGQEEDAGRDSDTAGGS